VELSATDPLNLIGLLSPGPRVPALRTNRVRYRDGLPVEETESEPHDLERARTSALV
jgi:ATP-dependent Lhr-like helicase